jgi:hypothetical protein
MEKSKVLARFKDGTLMKGHTEDFFPNKKDFHLELLSGEIVKIETEQLKSLFFVKDFEGDKKHENTYNGVVPGGGRKIQIKFKDGELIIGYSQGYSPDRPGFFIMPADLQGNNERIFVITSATEEVTVL